MGTVYDTTHDALIDIINARSRAAMRRLIDDMDALDGPCALCGKPIEDCGVIHRGLPAHPACWRASGEAPDIVAGRGFYGAEPDESAERPAGEYPTGWVFGDGTEVA